MALQVLLAATLRKYFPNYDHATGLKIEIKPGLTVSELAGKLELPINDIKLVMVNGLAAKWDTILQGDERVALFPPVGGG